MAAEIVVGKAIDSLYDHIQRELGYLLCFNNNIQELQTQLHELEATKNDVQTKEDAEKRSRRTLGKVVELWIENADGKITEAEKVIEDKSELQKGCFSIKWCPNLKLRFSLGRKGKKLSLVLNDLIKSGKDHLLLTGTDLPMPPINMSDYNGDASDFESRKKVMEEIIEMLMDKETRLIGICGMGGIGKTTLAKQVLQKVHDFHNNLFDIQVISTVSRPPNFNAIQQQVIEMLGGSSIKDIDHEIQRAELVRRAFYNKKVVVLLDDVWEEFDLNGKGFPLRESDCCKIIYTSRNQGLWSGERTFRKKEISLDVLSSEEAWNLFKRKVDPRDDDSDNDYSPNYEIGRKIVDECKGLPLALEVVGSALYKKETYHWEDMLSQMKNHHDLPSKIKAALKTSYDFLEEDNEKSLFLICCLFQEDEEIPIETLYRYAMGLQLFKGMMDDLYHIRNRVYTLVDDLITRNLLIHAQDHRTLGRLVKMHDVVRDVGLSIAKQEEKDIHFLICDQGVNQLQNYVAPNTKMISILVLKSGLKVPDDVMEFRGSKLELLRLQNSYGSDNKISWNLFQGADDLKVLDIYRGYMISEFPYLVKLKMLSLENMCLNIGSTVSFIKHLTCLETLSFRLSRINALPNEVGELKNLKVLDLTYCQCFIKDGILSRLTNLQELYMWYSFDNWKTLKEEDILSTIGEDNNNAAKLSELNFLDKLRRLELIVPNIKQVPRDSPLFSSTTLLKQFKISIGEGRRAYDYKFQSSERSQLWVEGKNVEDGVNLFDALGVLIKNGITSLYLHNDSNMWEQMYLNRHLSAMKDIILRHCGSIITLFVPSESSPQISHIEETNGFGLLLCRIEIYDCNQMRHLCSTSIFRHLKKLKILVLQNCERVEEVVSICNSKEEHEKIDFNTLETLELCEMGELTCFCKEIDDIYFHRLRILKLEGLTSFIFPTKIEIPQLKHLEIISLPSIITLCNIEVPSLQRLEIVHCDNLKYIFFSDSFMVKNIFNLQSLTITRCKQLKGVIKILSDTEEEQQISIKFSNLMKLKLICLDKLASFVIHANHLGDEDENEDENEEEPQNALFYCDEVSFSCLEELEIENLSKINYIVTRKCRGGRRHHRNIQESYDRTVHELQFFPNLSSLRLSGLDQLVSFVLVKNYNINDKSEKQNALFYEDDQVSFLCLKYLKIGGMPKINYIVGCKRGRGENNDIIEEKDDYDIKLQPPLFSILKSLEVRHLSNLIHMYQSNHPEGGVLLFQNVRELDIAHCEKLRYLFSENIGRVSTKHLEYIRIYNCPTMELVMENEKELGGEDDKAKREGTICHYFPLLHTLAFRDLLGLRRFCNIALTLPSLSSLEVSECPKLEALSPGYLDSPRLKSFKYDYSEELIAGDVNAALRDLIIKVQV